MQSKQRRIPAALAVLALAAAAALAYAPPDPPSPRGRWQGAIELPGQKLEVIVRIAAGEGGVWSGEIDIPAQGARNLPLTAFDVAARGAVRFSIAGIPGEPTFRGTLTSDGGSETLAGEFTQAGQKYPFRLARAADAAVSSANALEGFDAFVDEARKTWDVPGLAVAIVQDGEVVLAKGYGVRDVAGNLPVTPDTLFAIGS